MLPLFAYLPATYYSINPTYIYTKQCTQVKPPHYQTPIITVILLDKVIGNHTGNNLKLKLAFKAAQQEDGSKGSALQSLFGCAHILFPTAVACSNKEHQPGHLLTRVTYVCWQNTSCCSGINLSSLDSYRATQT